MTLSSKPDEKGCDVDKSNVVASEFVEACEDSPEVLDFVDKAFDQVAFLVEMAVIESLVLAV